MSGIFIIGSAELALGGFDLRRVVLDAPRSLEPRKRSGRASIPFLSVEGGAPGMRRPVRPSTAQAYRRQDESLRRAHFVRLREPLSRVRLNASQSQEKVMTLAEFKAWLEGYSASFKDGVPNAEQWTQIVNRLANVEQIVIPQSPVPAVPSPPFGTYPAIWTKPTSPLDPAPYWLNPVVTCEAAGNA